MIQAGGKLAWRGPHASPDEQSRCGISHRKRGGHESTVRDLIRDLKCVGSVLSGGGGCVGGIIIASFHSNRSSGSSRSVFISRGLKI